MKKMKLILIAGMLISLFSSSLYAQQKSFTLLSKSDKSQSLHWEKTTLDLGKVTYQKPAEVEFKFTNRSAAPILITKVKASCGCTATSYPREPVAPGQTATIKAKYSAASRGTFNKTIVVTTNSEPATTVLSLKGIVE